MVNLKDIINLILGIVLIGILIPRNEIDKFYFKKGILVKVKWIDGSISKLKKGTWVLKE